MFALAATLNYLDRSLLSNFAPRIRAEFHLTNQDYGWLLSAFYIAYGLAAPGIGWFLDWVGIEAGMAVSLAGWSIATLLTAYTGSFGQLVATRIGLGVFESASFPAAGKLNAMYLPPENRAIGAAVTQVGISLGTSAAALIAARALHWRSPFLICGALGMAWIPLWLWVRRSVPAPYAVPAQTGASVRLLRDPRLIVLSIANAFWMLSYGVWTGWSTNYLVDRFHLTPQSAAFYGWFPPIAPIVGGFAGGWLSRAFIRRGRDVAYARQTAILISAIGCLSTLLVPLCPTPLLASAAIGLSWFWAVAGSVNLYTIPVDIWGPERAGTAVSALVFSFGLGQALVSPVVGRMVDRAGYGGVFWLVALPPLLAWVMIRWGVRGRTALP